jgi:hypothetical protein
MAGLMLWSFPSHSHQDFCFPQEPKSIRDDKAAVGLSPSPEDRKAMIELVGAKSREKILYLKPNSLVLLVYKS